MSQPYESVNQMDYKPNTSKDSLNSEKTLKQANYFLMNEIMNNQ